MNFIGTIPLQSLRAYLALTLAIVAIAAWRTHILRPTIHELIGRFDGTVLGDLHSVGDEQSFRFHIDHGPTVSATLWHAKVVAGDRLRIRGRIENMGAARNPGEPDPIIIAHERGIAGRLSMTTLLRRLPARRGFHLTDRLAQFRGWALATLQKNVGEPYAAILAGELWGERGDLSQSLRDDFATTGTIHILVTAGLHIGALAALLFILVEYCAVPRALGSLAIGSVVWSYAFLSGMHLPTFRAALMISVAILARALGRKAFSWSALLIAAGGVLLVDPQAMLSASFLISFSCVAGLLTFATPLAHWLHKHTFLRGHVAEALAATVSTQILTWPLLAATFGYFSLYALIANALVVPTVGVSMFCGTGVLATARLPFLSRSFASIASWPLTWTLLVTHTLASLPAAKIWMPVPPAWVIAGYELSMLTLRPLWINGGRTLALALPLVMMTLIVIPTPKQFDFLQITMLDVGQGEGIVIQTPSGHIVMIDTGGRMEHNVHDPRESPARAVGERTVVPFLLRQGVRHVDAIILTHPHGDHVGGAAPILRAFSVGLLIDSGALYGGLAYNDALAVAQERHVVRLHPVAGQRLLLNDGVCMTFLTPLSPTVRGTRADVDENSLVIQLQYKKFRMLFTGDIEARAEAALLKMGVDLHSDVLKVPHHGSGHSASDAFIEAVGAHTAVISVGQRNRYAEPAPNMLRALKRASATIYRTDQDGAISIVSDGQDYTVTPYISPADESSSLKR